MSIYYLEIDIICIVILLILLDKFKDECELNSTSKYYKATLLTTIFFSFFDLITGILRGTMHEYSRLVLIISNSLYLWSGSLIGYFYTNYILHKIEMKQKNWQKILIFIPVILVMVSLIINLFNRMLFNINENNLYSRSKYTYLFNIIIAIYIVIILFNLLHCYFKNINNRKKQEEIKNLLIFIGIPIISAFIQNLYSITIEQASLTLSILFIYFDFQKKDSTVDELTEIYNRRAFNRNANRLFNSKKIIFLMLIDADGFKLINDKYGHLEGDKALVKITNILKKAISNTGKDHFLARYGGDEFIIVGKVNGKTDIDELIRYIEDEENKYNENNESKYKISLSIGYSLRNDTHTSVEDLIENADAQMYKIKKAKKIAEK